MVRFIKIFLGWLSARVYECGANLYGTIQHPYLTWKRVVNNGHGISSLILLVLFSGYFGIREPIRWGNISWQGIILHQVNLQSVKLWASISMGRLIASILSYLVVVCLLTLLGKIMVKNFIFKKGFIRVFKVWIYSYLPTFLWFLFTAGMFVLLPPPRQMTIKGLGFSFLFLVISSGLLIWKMMLYLVTLKIGLEMNQKQIFWSTVILIPCLFIFAQIMYWMNLFNVPYI